jgi:proline iminopeptidase
LSTFRRCRDRFTLVFYDHRCNGRSIGPPVSSMTWENLTADADAGGSGWWARQNAPRILAERGFAPRTVRLVQRFFNGWIAPQEMLPAMMRFGRAYYHRHSNLHLVRSMLGGGWRAKMRPEAFIQAGRELLDGWTVMDRLGEIEVPTLVIAGRDYFVFPPEHQVELAAGLPHGQLRIIERAGHNAHEERPDQVMTAVRDFIGAAAWSESQLATST